MATISIIMPVYNSKEYLKEAINSILDQTYTDWEFLIINEFGSDDGSKEIIEEYAKYDKRIILIQNEERLGIAASMNVGIDRASGKYVARMDADDISLPERFEKQVKFMNDNPDIGMCGCKVEIFGSDPFEWKLETDKNKLNTNILFYSPSVHPTVMIRKEILDTYNLRYNEDYKASEDYELFSRICSITSVANIDEVLFRYRIMKNNATFRNNDIGIVLYSKVMENQFKKMGLEFTEQEIQLLSPHYSMKQTQGRDVLVKLSNLDLLLKKILVSNEKCKLYDRKYLSNTLHKRFEEAYNSISWECKDYDRKKVDEIYDKSIFKNEFFYEKKIKKENITPIVTVLLPAYNSEKYIADTIWSVLDQTFSDFELLIVNEFGSNDDTVQIINMFDDPRIKIIQNKERLGLAESLNLGMKEAKGKYIARIDADDLCSKDRFQLQVEFLEENEEYGVCGSWQHHFGIDTDYIHKVPMSNEDLKAAFIYNCELCHSTLMLRKKYFIDNNLFFDKNAAAEDYELWTRAIYKFKFANIPRVLGEYRIGEDNITAKKMERLSEESSQIVINNIKNHLNIQIPEDHKKYMTGWINEFNNISNDQERKKVINVEKKILKEMWKSNKKIGAYNESSLLKVISSRWDRCNNVYSGNYENIKTIDDVFACRENDNINEKQLQGVPKGNILKRIVKKLAKKILKRIYAPVKRRVFDEFQKQLWDLDGHLWDLEGHIKDFIYENNNMNEIISSQKKLLEKYKYIEKKLNELAEIDNKIVEAKDKIIQTTDSRIWEAENKILRVQDERIWKSELENKKNINEFCEYMSRYENWIIEQNQINLDFLNKTDLCDFLLLNDTFNTFHHGSTGTSLAIMNELRKRTEKPILRISLQDASMPKIIYPNSIEDFTSLEFFEKWELHNKDIISKIKMCKHIVVNGEGCISHYNNGTLNLLYIIYISKIKFNKKVSIINHSIFINNYVDKLSSDEYEDFCAILNLVYGVLDNCKVREKYSLKQLNEIIKKKGELSFDCLPLYIDEIYKGREQELERKYITISGGNFLGEWYAEFIYGLYDYLKINFPNSKMIFLYSDIPYSNTTGDIEVYNEIKDKIGENNIILKKVSLADEWLKTIQQSHIVISGRFHHSIASFMLDTPFFAFKTNTKKLEGILEIMNKEDYLLDSENLEESIKKVRELMESEKCKMPNDLKIKNEILNLAKNNFDGI